MNKVKWLLKQLLPLNYWTKYEEEGKKYFTIWNMWLGVSYNIIKFEI